MEIVVVARVLTAALVAGAEAVAEGGLSPVSVTALRSLRETLTRALGTEQVSEGLAGGLPALPEAELRNVLVLAQVVLAEVDPEGTAAGHYAVPGDGGDVHVVRGRGAGRQVIDPVRQLAGTGVPDAFTGQVPIDADRIDLVLAHRSPGHADAVLAVARELLADRERVLGPEHPETLSTRTNLAYLHHAALSHCERHGHPLN